MQLLKAVANWFRVKDKQAAEALDNPVETSALAIDDAKKQIGEITKAIAKYMAEMRKIERAIPEYTEQIKKYNATAEKAVEAGKDDLAEQALEIVEKNEKLLAGAKKNLKNMEVKCAAMRKKQDSYKRKVSDASVNQKTLAAQHEMNKANKALQEATNSFDGNSDAFAKLDRLQSMVESDEDELDAMDELTKDSSADLDEFMEENSTSDRLAALKAKKAKKKTTAKK